MLTPSSGTLADYISAIKNGNATHARIVFPVQNITLTDDNIAADGGIVITGLMNPDDDLTIGSAVSTEVAIRLINSNVFSGFDWTEEFHIDFGVEISGTTNWVTVGYFTGVKPERTALVQLISFVAYDRMQKFNVPADDFLATVTFPVTMSTLYHDLCTYLNLNYVTGNEMVNAMAMSYSENPFPAGCSCRDILGWIAEANGCNARITAGGDVKLVWFADQTGSYSLSTSEHFGVNIDEAEAPAIDAVRISNTDDADGGFVYPVSNTTVYESVDNPLLIALSSANKTTVLTNLVTRFTAFGSYRPAVVNAIGNWMVEAGDIIEVAYDGNSTTDLPVFRRTFAWNGGCADDYECTGKTDRSGVSDIIRQKYETGEKLANKYTIQSGVDITDDGITVSGGKWVKIISGGTLDVQSTNFVLDSTNRILQTGDWTVSEDGLYHTESGSVSGTDFTYSFGIDEGWLDPEEYVPTGTECKTRIMYTSNGLRYIEGFEDPMYASYINFEVENPFSGNWQTVYLDFFELEDGYHCTLSCDDRAGNNFQIGSESRYVDTGLFDELAVNSFRSTSTQSPVTWNSNYVTPANCEAILYKIGSIMFLTMTIYVKSNITAGTNLGSLKTAYRPNVDIIAPGITINAASQSIKPVQLLTTGAIRMTSATASANDATAYKVTFVYNK